MVYPNDTKHFGLTHLLDAYPEAIDINCEMRSLLGFIREGDYASKALIEKTAQTTHFDTRNITELDIHMIILSIKSLFDNLPRTYSRGFTRNTISVISGTSNLAQQFVIPYLEARQAIKSEEIKRPKPEFVLTDKLEDFLKNRGRAEREMEIKAYYPDTNFNTVYTESRDTIKKAITATHLNKGLNHLGIMNMERGFNNRTKSLIEQTFLNIREADYSGQGRLTIAHYFKGKYYPEFFDEVLWRPVQSIAPVIKCNTKKRNGEFCKEPAKLSFTLPTFEVETTLQELIQMPSQKLRTIEKITAINPDKKAVCPVYSCKSGHKIMY